MGAKGRRELGTVKVMNGEKVGIFWVGNLVIYRVRVGASYFGNTGISGSRGEIGLNSLIDVLLSGVKLRSVRDNVGGF